MLDSLYQDGKPTEINKAEYQEEVDVKAEVLVTAVKACNRIKEEFQKPYLADAKLAYNGIDVLANRLFNSRALKEVEYTQDSWDAFILARTEALDWYNSHSVPVKIGDNEHKLYTKSYMNLSNACYGLVPSEETVKVSLDIVDCYAAKKNVTACDCAVSYNLTLLAGASLDDAFKAALDDKSKMAKKFQPLKLKREKVLI